MYAHFLGLWLVTKVIRSKFLIILKSGSFIKIHQTSINNVAEKVSWYNKLKKISVQSNSVRTKIVFAKQEQKLADKKLCRR